MDMKVLSAHRSAVTRTAVGMVLTRGGHAVTSVEATNQLLNKLQAGTYDAAVISDVYKRNLIVVVSNFGVHFANLMKLGTELPVAMNVIVNEMYTKMTTEENA